jgi:hypothetical protein
MSSSIPPSNIPLVDENGFLSTPWYRYLASLQRATDEVVAGDIATDTGSGLHGGGSIADGVSLSIADNGVTNAMFRQGAGTSILGRKYGSTGDLADIIATANNQVLSRESGALVFTATPTLDGLGFSGSATVSAATPSTHKFAVTIGGAAYYFLVTT